MLEYSGESKMGNDLQYFPGGLVTRRRFLEQVGRDGGTTVLAGRIEYALAAGAKVFPDPVLVDDKIVLGAKQDVIKTVLNGRGGMPRFVASLDDQRVADILSCVRSAWGNSADPVQPADMGEIRHQVSAGEPHDYGN